MKRILVPLLLACVISLPLSGQVVTSAAESPFRIAPPPASTSLRIPKGSAFVTVDRARFDKFNPSTSMKVVIEDFPLTGNYPGNLVLQRFEVLDPSAPVVAGTTHGDSIVERERGLFFHGHVEGIPGSWVYLAIFRDYASGYIELPTGKGDGRERLTIAPLDMADGLSSTMVVYNEKEALALNNRAVDWHCGAEEQPQYKAGADEAMESYRRDEKRREERSQLQSNTMLVAQLAIDCDSAYYVAHSRNLSRAVNYALTVMGSVSAIYQRDMNVVIQVPYLRVWTGADPYPGTSSAAILGQFRTYWNANMSAVQRTLAHCFSVSNIGGGIAYVNVLCASRTSGSGYAVSGLYNTYNYPTTAYAWDTDVASHEIGHNFGSSHTHACSWSPPIDSCYAAEGGCFTGTNPRVGTIMSYCHLTSFGTQLYFHPRVASLIRTRAEAASCVSALDNSTANDVGVVAIVVPEPGGGIASGANFTPQAIFRNMGTANQSSLAVNFTIRDSAGNSVYSNTQTIASLPAGSNATVNFTATSIATINRYSATVTVTLASDGFQANNTLSRPFEILSGVTGSITVTAPNLPTKYRAGANATIAWTATGPTNLIIEFSPDNGATWSNIRYNQSAAAGTIAWTVPSVATTQGRIRISDRTNVSVKDLNDSLFTITIQPLDWQWARSGGGPNDDVVGGVATDNARNVIVTGTFTDSISFGTTTLISAGGTDVFVVKYNAGGTVQWAKAFGGPQSDEGRDVATDGSGNIYLIGGFSSTARFGILTGVSAGNQDAFLVKLDPSGTPIWLRSGGGSNRDIGRDVAVDDAGNSAFSGSISGTANFSGTPVAGSSVDAFVASYNASGTLQWVRSGGGGDTDEATGVALDGSGNVYITGRFRGPASFGASSLVNAGGDDIFTVKYNSLGTVQWAAAAGGSGDDEGRSLAVDASGSVFVTGGINSTVNFGTNVTRSAGGRDMFLARYKSTGTLDWIRRGGTTGDDWGVSLGLDGSGNCYVGGFFTDALEIASLRVTSGGGSGVDAFVARYDPNGGAAWIRRGGGSAFDETSAMTVAPNGDCAYVAGRFSYNGAGDPPSIFGSDSLRGAGVYDVLVSRLAMFKVISPRASDVWRVGDSAWVRWTQPEGTVNVRIDYSSDNGGTWTTLATSTPNDGSQQLIVPAPITANAIIRLVDADLPAVNGDAYSETFTVESLLPATDLVATGLDARVAVTWSPSPAAGVTAYELYRGRLPNGPLAFLKTIPVATPFYNDFDVINCNDYFYAVKARIGASESTFSNLDTAQPAGLKTIKVKLPLANALIPAGSETTVNWGTTGCIDAVSIEFTTDGGNNWESITPSAANAGSWLWSVPIIPSTHAQIRVTDVTNGTILATGDTFSICNPTVDITANGPVDLCPGDSVRLSATPGQHSYRWSNGDTTQQIVVRTSGNYQVTIVDGAGCSSAAVAAIAVTVRPELPKPTIDTVGAGLVFCEGESVKLVATPGYSGYIWSNGDTTRSITVTRSGTYAVRVADSIGCSSSSDAVTVRVHQLPAIPTIVRIPGTDSLVATGGGAGEYRWRVGDSTITSPLATLVIAQRDGFYRVTVVDSNGCTVTSDSLYITGLVSTVDPTTGERGLVIQPNPTRGGSFSISLDLRSGETIDLVLYDIAGREVLRHHDAAAGSLRYNRTINAADLPAGTYLLELRSSMGRVWKEKVVRQ